MFISTRSVRALSIFSAFLLSLVCAAPVSAQLGLVDSGFLYRFVEAHEQGSRHGESIVFVDIDGDGFPEIATGQPSWDGDPDSDIGLVANRGRVLLDFSFTTVIGDRRGAARLFFDQCLDGEPGDGESPWGAGYQFGAALSAGDYNDDGFGDLVIGMPGAMREDIREGAVCVLYGAPSRNPDDYQHQRLRKPSSASSETEDLPTFGSVLYTANLDQDRYVDLLIGAPGADHTSFTETRRDAGVGLLVYGGPFGLFALNSKTLATGNFTGAVPAVANERFGVSFAVGDFLVGDNERGASYPDLLIGADTSSGEGRLWGYVGLPDGELSELPVSVDDDWDLIGTRRDGDQFAHALAVGDFDGNGHDDLAIGIPGDNDLALASEAGAVLVLYGPAASIDVGEQLFFESVLDGHAGGVTAFDRFGEVLATGDFDSDGIDELVIGAPLDNPFDVANAGEVTVLYGRPGGLTAAAVQVWNGIFFEKGLEIGDEFGAALAAAPYGPGSFADDLVVGVPGKARGTEDPGAGHNVLIQSIVLFADGFESGDISAWGAPEP